MATNKKNSSSDLVSGLGMAMAFIQALVNEIVARGGFEEMLHMLTTEHGKPVVKQLAEFIMKSPWRIPRSLVERLVAAGSSDGEMFVDRDVRFNWNIIDLEMTFRIPVVHFRSPLPVPGSITNQLGGKIIQYPVVVDWNNEQYIIVSCPDGSLELGEIYDGGEMEFLALVPTKYFDLER